jgi:hypothetical protein
MPKAILTLDDVEGDMNLSLFLEGGFQVESNAHQAANLIIKYLSELGAVKEASEVKELTGAEAQAVIDDANRIQNVANGGLEPLDDTAAPEVPTSPLILPPGVTPHHPV